MLTLIKIMMLFMHLSSGAILDKRLISSRNILEISNNIFKSEEDTHPSNEIDLHSEESKQRPTFVHNVQINNEDDHPNSVNERPIVKEFTCNLNQSLIDEIKSYKGVANKIFETLLLSGGEFKGRTYQNLANFVDKFGSRLAGSQNLENSIDYMLAKMTQDGLDNVHGESVTIPHWVRGEESAELIYPRIKTLSMLGLGFSVGTPLLGITAEVLVVKSFEDLKKKANKAKGKIIVYNEDYVSYGDTVVYRGNGAVEAAKAGGVASLIRSITPFSINSPHTGMQSYQANVTKIPTACITVEDAQLLQRLQDDGVKLIIHLKMGAKNLPFVTSRNAIGEIQGHEKPDEVVVVSGHIDSWDVGQGAMDDGGGLMISAEALSVLKFLNLRPRRTLRAILWTTEEFGLWGVQEYIKKHKNELDNFNAVFESDIGTFRPLGLDFSGSGNAGCIIQEVLKLLASINATEFRSMPEVGSDIGYFIQKGVPGISLNTENSKYFWFHHSQGDTMTVENSDELDLCTAVWTVSSYVIADLSVSLPRN